MHLTKLTGKSLKGKNRVRERGEIWEVLRVTDKVLFSAEPGPWLLLQSTDAKKSLQWVHSTADQDFDLKLGKD